MVIGGRDKRDPIVGRGNLVVKQLDIIRSIQMKCAGTRPREARAAIICYDLIRRIAYQHSLNSSYDGIPDE